MNRSCAELSLAEIDGLIRGEEMLLDLQKRETDHVTLAMKQAYDRIERLEAEKLARIGSVWRKSR